MDSALMPDPLVSIVLPVFNAATYLREAVDSMLAQSLTDFELIAVDDGSTDNSLALLQYLATTDNRIRILSRPNTGIVGALNDGIAISRGEFIARMDADDYSHPLRLEKQLHFLQTHPDHVAVGCEFYYIGSRGEFLIRSSRIQDPAAIEARLLLGDGGTLIHPSVLFRAAAIKQVGAYRQEAIWIEDLDLYLRLAQIGKLANLPEALFWYRLHEGSVNFTKNAGRLERKLRIMEEAWKCRGLEFSPDKLLPTQFNTAFTPETCLDFAIAGLSFGKQGRPWYWMRRSFQAAPANKRTWHTLSYLLQAKVGRIRIPQLHPESDL